MEEATVRRRTNAAAPTASSPLIRIVATAVSFLGVGAFLLSFAALRDLAHAAGVPAGLAWIWPLIIDGFILVATLATLALRGTRTSWYPWTALVVFAILSVTGNAVHVIALPTDSLGVPAPIAVAVASVPAIALLLASHMLVVLAGTPARAATSEEPTPQPIAEPTTALPELAPIPAAPAHAATNEDPESPTTAAPADAIAATVAEEQEETEAHALPAGPVEEPVEVAASIANDAHHEDIERIRQHVIAGGRVSGNAIAAILGVSRSTGRRRLSIAKQRYPDLFEATA